MKIISNTGGVFATTAYLVVDEASKQAVVFDAPDHTTGPLLDRAEQNGWDVVGLWLTHGHIDHIADHAEVTGRFPSAKVLVHPLDEPKLRNPRSMYALPFETPARSGRRVPGRRAGAAHRAARGPGDRHPRATRRGTSASTCRTRTC